MAQIISLVLSNLPVILFVVAILVALAGRRGQAIAGRLLDWMLLLPVGIGGVWAGFFHVTFPEIAARSIGWQVSPFQFEIGVADMAIGTAAIISFWRSLPSKAAVGTYVVLFNRAQQFWPAAAGHRGRNGDPAAAAAARRKPLPWPGRGVSVSPQACFTRSMYCARPFT